MLPLLGKSNPSAIGPQFWDALGMLGGGKGNSNSAPGGMNPLQAYSTANRANNIWQLFGGKSFMPSPTSMFGLNNPGSMLGAGGMFSSGALGSAGSGLGMGAADFGGAAGTGGAGFGIGEGAIGGSGGAAAGGAGAGMGAFAPAGFFAILAAGIREHYKTKKNRERREAELSTPENQRIMAEWRAGAAAKNKAAEAWRRANPNATDEEYARRYNASIGGDWS